MKMPNMIIDYWEYIIMVIILVFVWPILYPLTSTISPAFNNLNIIFWLFGWLILVATFDSERRKTKKRRSDTWAGSGYEWQANISRGYKKLRRISTDTLAWLIFLIILLGFFIWLVIFV